MHKWRCCCSAVRWFVLWYWQLRKKFKGSYLYTYFHLFCHIRHQDRTWIRSSQIRLYLQNIILGDVTFILLKVFLIFREISCFLYDGRYQSPSTKSHFVSSQEAEGFRHTPVDTARIERKKTSVYWVYIQKISVILNDNLHSESHKPYGTPQTVTWLAGTT